MRRKEEEEMAERPQTKTLIKSNALNLWLHSRKRNKMGSLSFPVPNDIAIKIASSLQVSDLCALAGCCRFWRELCWSDCIWESLARNRWPAITKPLSTMGWRSFYIEVHKEKAASATSVIQFVQKCSSFESLEVGAYQKAIQDLHALQFGCQDVEMFLFKPELTVLVHLLGLHYCVNWLRVPAKSVLKALQRSKISERQVCVKWWKLGRWSHGYRMRDELVSRRFTLLDVGLAKQEEVLAVLYRGAIHEVLRVQICVSDPLRTSWSCQRALV